MLWNCSHSIWKLNDVDVDCIKWDEGFVMEKNNFGRCERSKIRFENELT